MKNSENDEDLKLDDDWHSSCNNDTQKYCIA